MTKTMLASDCIIIPVDDARKLVDAFLKLHDFRRRAFTKKDLERMRDDGVFSVLDGLRDNVRAYDSIWEHLLEC